MKKTILGVLAAAALSAPAFAGQPVYQTGKESKTFVEPCFKETELQLDVFGSYTDARSGSIHDDGFGGGLALNYYFIRYVGIGVEGNLRDGGESAIWNYGGRLLFRYPIDSNCLAPYAFVAGGAESNGETNGTVGVGGGLEYRVVSQKLGIFGEGRYTWGSDDFDGAQVRVGVRFVF
jgi:opacity protein-like surface antigen